MKGKKREEESGRGREGEGILIGNLPYFNFRELVNYLVEHLVFNTINILF